MDLSQFLQRLRAGGDESPGMVDAVHVQPARPARMQPFPEWLHPSLADALHTRGIVELYGHQRECADLLVQLQRPLRLLLNYHCGVGALRTRQMMLDLQTL